jgi:para-aminobenzoate synthetase/4-amino-4-deoxychorismate lyase
VHERVSLPSLSPDLGRDGDALILVDHGARWVECRAPQAVLTAAAPSDVAPLLREVDASTRRGDHFAVGAVAYEAGAAWRRPTRRRMEGGSPLAVFALYDPASVREVSLPRTRPAHAVGEIRPSLDERSYADAFARVKRHIVDGDTYQVNGTFSLEAPCSGDPLGLFLHLACSQRGRYAAWLRVGGHEICSASPELFFARQGSRLVARPMKGSARRGLWPDHDRQAALGLRASAKERAENVMVVDMVRNDLGRVARVGSVHVRRLFALERYPTIWQMTSEIVADSDAPLDALFEATFPSASITGAPKSRTMEVIEEIEGRPRGFYTGAVGHVRPGGDAQFNVAIRTAVVDRVAGRLSFGVGSGIVWDSDAGAEYRECLLKGDVLLRRTPNFELLETLAWSPDVGFAYVGEHLERLARSAAHFAVPLQTRRARSALDRAVASSSAPLRVRLLVDLGGEPRVECAPLEVLPPVVRACFARQPIDREDRFYYHKTTHRAEYERRRCDRCEDVILWNEDGDVTESIAANVVVEREETLVTPPVSAGLLAGTARAALLRECRIVQSRVTRDDLCAARRAWLVNSVRGWRALQLDPHGG